MGQAYDCECLDCGEAFKTSEGGGFAFIQWLCDSCGETTAIPRYAPRVSREMQKIIPALQRRTNIFKLGRVTISMPFTWRIDKDRKAIPMDKIERFTPESLRSLLDDNSAWWTTGADYWDDFEKDMLRQAIGPCSCGGSWFDPNDVKHRASTRINSLAFHRCPKCRSKNFKYHATMLFD